MAQSVRTLAMDLYGGESEQIPQGQQYNNINIVLCLPSRSYMMSGLVIALHPL